ncbi:MAG: cupin domain-containing protein [Negativicutes bacterium]|nr:cupin domain-containing protein [Negativicutes bacterium]
MKRVLLATLVCLFLLSVSALAASPGDVIGDKSLIDTKYDKGMVIGLDEFYASHPLKAGEATRGDVVFESPRCQVVIVTNHGPLIGLHYHQSADEIVYVHKGKGEMYIDGKWIPVKAGDLHFNPRGVIHATRVVGNEDLQVYSIFTPPQAGGNDKMFIDSPQSLAVPGDVVGSWSLLDTKFEKGQVVSLPEFYASHPLKAGEATRGDVVFESPRSQIVVVTNHGPLIGLHYHQSAEEIVFVYKGQGEMYIGGKWVPVKAGDLHINPRGVIHATRVVGNEDMQVFSVFCPPQANGNDKVFIK